MQRIFLTGCSGYIGRTMAPYLKQRGFSVYGFDRMSYPYAVANLDGFIQGDLRDEAVLRRSLDGIDTIFHLAAARTDWGLSDKQYFDDNVTATRTLLRVAGEREVKNWLFFSTVGVMGPSISPLDEAAPIAPINAYGESKAAAEELFRQFAARQPSARVLIIRPSVVFGPDNPTNTNVYRLIDAIHNNKFVMVGKGDAIKATSYIENLVAATFFVVERMREGVQTFIYVDEPKLSTANMVDQICSLLQKKRSKLRIPLGIAAPLAQLADFTAAITGKDLPITAARISKFCRPTNFDGTALRRLGFKQPVPIEEALRRTMQWYLQQRVQVKDLQ
jgi:nucleoside-diphosphate-sugar epimerase